MNTLYRHMRYGRHDGWPRRLLVATLIAVAAVIQPLSLSFGTSVASAQDAAPSEESTLKAKLDQKGTIILRDASLVEWIFAIQREWGIDIVVGNELQRDIVNGGFTDTPLREVLTSILYSRGYGYRQVGESLLIMRLDDMTIKPDQNPVLISLDFLQPQEVESSVQLLLSQTGQVSAIQSSKSLFIIDSPEVIDRVRSFLNELEENARRTYEREQARLQAEREAAAGVSPDNTADPSDADPSGVDVVEVVEQTKIFQVQYVPVESLAEAIQNVAINSRSSVIPEENKIVVVGSEQDINVASQIITQLDRPRKQVRITAYMYDVNVSVMERLGFNWSNVGRGRIGGSGDPGSVFDFQNNSFQQGTAAAASGGDAAADAGAAAAPAGDPTAATGTETAATTAAATAAAPVVGGLITLSHLSRHFDFTTAIQALDQTDGARLLARPNIMAYDRTEASFQSVQEIPVQQLTQTSEGGNIGTTEFREAGISLTVTPTITNDNSVVLQVTPEFSVLNGFNAGQPIIDRRQATTTLRLNNGEAAVIGGLVRRNEIESDNGVPGIMHWKYIGRLFRGHEATVTESELVVFIRAEVVEASFPGDPRDQSAHATVEELVNQIPFATPAPIVGSCADPYCPYHNPRPRVTGEIPYDYKHPHAHYHESPVQVHQQGAEWLPAQPMQTDPNQPAPSRAMQPLPDPVISNQSVSTPAGNPAAEQAPSVTPDAAPADGGVEPSPVDVNPAETGQPTDVHFDTPPPVIIDEMARRYRNGRVALRRLPSVGPQSPRQAQQAPPIVLTPNRQATAQPPRVQNYRTANANRRLTPLPPTQPVRTPPAPPRKNWLENLFQR